MNNYLPLRSASLWREWQRAARVFRQADLAVAHPFNRVVASAERLSETVVD
jgi:hypothetical protein